MKISIQFSRGGEILSSPLMPVTIRTKGWRSIIYNNNPVCQTTPLTFFNLCTFNISVNSLHSSVHSAGSYFLKKLTFRTWLPINAFSEPYFIFIIWTKSLLGRSALQFIHNHSWKLYLPNCPCCSTNQILFSREYHGLTDKHLLCSALRGDWKNVPFQEHVLFLHC